MAAARPRFPPTSRHNAESLASNATYTVPAHLLARSANADAGTQPTPPEPRAAAAPAPAPAATAAPASAAAPAPADEWRVDAQLERLVDRFGFVAEAEAPLPAAELVRLENSRLRKWTAMRGGDGAALEPAAQAAMAPARRKQLSRRVHKGVPEPLRGVTWEAMSGASALRAARRSGAYARWKARAVGDGALDRHVVEQIERDLPRTFPRHTMWRASGYGAPPLPPSGDGGGSGGSGSEEAAGLQMLRCVLRSYALLDSEVLYVQAMNYVVGALLMYQTEEVAFWTFTQLMWGVGLRRCFLQGLPLVMSCLDALGDEIQRQLPRLHKHFEAAGVMPSAFAISWFMCFGLDKLPFGVAVKLLDLVCAERSLRPIFRFSIAILRLNEPQLLAIDAIQEPADLHAACASDRLADAIGSDPNGFFASRVASVRLQLPEGLLSSAWMAGADLTMAINETPLDGELDGTWLARLFSDSVDTAQS